MRVFRKYLTALRPSAWGIEVYKDVTSSIKFIGLKNNFIKDIEGMISILDVCFQVNY